MKVLCDGNVLYSGELGFLRNCLWSPLFIHKHHAVVAGHFFILAILVFFYFP